MLFPDKLFSYHESVISKFPLVLEQLEYGPENVVTLFNFLKSRINNVDEFMDILDCLYALGKIEYDKEEKVVRYVK